MFNRAILAAGLLLACASPAFAIDTTVCKTVDEDKIEMAGKPGVEWLGVKPMPYTKSEAVFYSFRGTVYVSPIDTNGCVNRNMYLVGPYVPEQSV